MASRPRSGRVSNHVRDRNNAHAFGLSVPPATPANRLPVVLLGGYPRQRQDDDPQCAAEGAPTLPTRRWRSTSSARCPIDQHLVEGSGPDETIVMANGCLCCNLSGDVENAVHAPLRPPRGRRVAAVSSSHHRALRARRPGAPGPGAVAQPDPVGDLSPRSDRRRRRCAVRRGTARRTSRSRGTGGAGRSAPRHKDGSCDSRR